MKTAIDQRYDIAIRIRTIMQPFNSLDPSPFHERDLDPHTEEFAVGWVRELPRGVPLRITVELPADEAAKPEAATPGEAFANYFGHRARAAERDLRELFRVGWVANWRPIEIYLYDWWPIRRRIVLLRRIAAAPVTVRSI